MPTGGALPSPAIRGGLDCARSGCYVQHVSAETRGCPLAAQETSLSCRDVHRWGYGLPGLPADVLSALSPQVALNWDWLACA